MINCDIQSHVPSQQMALKSVTLESYPRFSLKPKAEVTHNNIINRLTCHTTNYIGLKTLFKQIALG